MRLQGLPGTLSFQQRSKQNGRIEKGKVGADVARLKTRQIHVCLQKSIRTYVEEKGIRNVNNLMLCDLRITQHIIHLNTQTFIKKTSGCSSVLHSVRSDPALNERC